MKSLIVFTGGGLAPALNPTIYGVVTAAREKGWRVLGGLYGWQSLLAGGRHVDLTNLNIESLKENGGTILRSSRTNPYATPDGAEQVKRTIQALGIDAVVAIGGDDTLGAAAKLAAEGIPIIGIPKTVDNDLPGTYFTPGFPSAAYYLATFVNEIKRDAAYALSRIYIIEAMGFKAGWLTCAGVLGGADIVLPPEWKISWKHTLDLLSQRYKDNGNFAVVVVSQEAHFDEPLQGLSEQQLGDEHGHVRKSFICLTLRDKIRADLGIEAKALYPGNYVETGKPIALDRDLAIALGRHAVALISDGVQGVMTRITRPDPAQLHLTVDTLPFPELALQKHRPLEQDMFDIETLLPTKAFFDYMTPLTADFTQLGDPDYLGLMQEITAIDKNKTRG
ncbi:6-phosphofructokinase [Candidatus Uhrbacteria bacterium]|nr:6-phosphofructokinase [Candidatus Uhrbacteria bacterium]